MMMTSWQRWSATDIGNRRAQNEDALVCLDYEGLWAVIDGMGGINAGNVASAALAHAIEHLELKSSLADAVDQIERATDAGKEDSGILHLQTALDDAFCQVSHHADRRE